MRICTSCRCVCGGDGERFGSLAVVCPRSPCCLSSSVAFHAPPGSQLEDLEAAVQSDPPQQLNNSSQKSVKSEKTNIKNPFFALEEGEGVQSITKS